MPTVQYIGSDPTWGPQQQVARRHAIEQTSVTLGLGDYDPTVRGHLTGGEPYQLRWRDSTVAVIEANKQWLLNRQTSVTLGLGDADPTVRPNYQAANPYQLRVRERANDAAEINKQWLFNRLNTNDLGLANADPTVQQPWIYEHPFSLYRRDSTYAGVSAWYQQLHLWEASTPVTIDVDADPTLVRREFVEPYQLRFRESTTSTVQAFEAWLRLRLNTNDLGLSDYDPTVKAPYQDPWQRRREDPARYAVGAYDQWAKNRLSTNELGLADQDINIRPVYQDPHQRRHLDPAYAVQPTLAWLRKRLSTNELGLADLDINIRQPWPYANPWHLRTRPSWPTQRIYFLPPGTAVIVLVDPTPYETTHLLDGERDYDLDGVRWYLLEGRRDYKRRP